MAETIEGLYLRIGLKYDELNQDFVAIEETLSSNMARLNRQNKIINLKAQIDLTGVTDESKKLEIQQRALSQRLEIARQKVKLYESAWLGAAKAQGTLSDQARKAEVALKQQQLYLARLSQSLKEVTDRQKELAAAQAQSKSPLGIYQGFKGDISGAIGQLTSAFNGLKEASSSADSAITKSLEIISAIPSPVGKAIAAFASIPLVIKGVENSLMNLAKPAISSGDAIYAMSRGVQMSIADFAKFSTVCKVTGIEISEVTNTIRRLQTQITKAGENNALTRMLERYGVAVRDSNGELKDALKMSEALAEGLKKAQEAGRGREFISSLGRGVSGDFVTYLEDLAGNMELASKIVKNGLANPALAHEVQGNINALNTQAAQLGGAFSSALMPVVNQIVPQTMERLGELTKVVQENADNIKQIGYAVAEVTETVEKFGTAIAKAAIEGTKNLITSDKSRYNPYALFDKYKDDKSIRDVDKNGKAIVSVMKLAEKELERYSESARQSIRNSDREWQAHVNKLVPAVEKINSALDDLIKKEKESAKSAKSWANFRNETDTKATEEEIQEMLDRVKKYAEELGHIQIDLEFGEDSYGKSLAELDDWYKKALEKAGDFTQERNQIEELAAAKIEQIERDKENKISEIREKANSHFRTDLQNQLAAIEKQKQQWINIGMEEAEAETLAQREKADAISKLNAEVAEKLDSIWQSSLEKRLAEIEREKQAWIQKGIDEVKATQWAEQAKADAQKSAAMEVLKNNLKEYRAFQEGGYEGLKNYQLNQLAKNGIHFSDLDMTPQQLADFKKAQQIAQNSLLPNFMTEKDRQFELSQTLKSKIEEQERRRAEAEKWAAGIMVDGKPTAPKQFYDMFGALPDEALENLKQQLENAGNAAENFQQQLDAETETPPENIDAPFEDLSTKIENVNSNFDDLTPTIENISSNFDDISATIENLSSEFDNLTATLENVNGNFENLAAVLENIGNTQTDAPQLPQTENPATPLNINDLISVFDVMKPTLENLNGNFGELSPTLENVNSYFSELTPQIQNASNYFGGLSENALSATEAFSHLAEKINALDLSLKSSPEITNNVTINEAHAWDYSHIQELAEKVADVITPKILSAIGGNSNGY